MLPIIVRLWCRWTGKGPEFIKGSYTLTHTGWFLNIVGLLYLIFACITFNFPSVTPVTSANMNYTCAAVGASVMIAAVNWFTTGRKVYTGPLVGTHYHNEVVIEASNTMDHSQPQAAVDTTDTKVHTS